MEVNKAMDLMEIKQLSKDYTAPIPWWLSSRSKQKQFKQPAAVDAVSLTIGKGEAVGLVGESGSGKSTLARMICRIEQPNSGQMVWKGEDILRSSVQEMKSFRKKVQMIFQDPISSLTPHQTIGESIAEPLINFKLCLKGEIASKVRGMMERVGLNPELYNRYPSELSGGQNQRVNIARALMSEPELVVCDEPISSLDATVQTQILDLLKALQQQFGLSYLFISHDLSAVRWLCERIVVMYQGEIVEMLPAAGLAKGQHHPYTQLLLASIPQPDPRQRQQPPLNASLMNALEMKADQSNDLALCGCRFFERCPFAITKCKHEKPHLQTKGKQHWIACHL